jgi:hypothetical protein
MLTVTCNASYANQFTPLHIETAESRRDENPSSTLLVVARRLDALVRLHRHIADNNSRSILARNTDRSSASANTRRDLKEVVIGACSGLPRLAISRDFHLRRATVGIDDLGREPVS